MAETYQTSVRMSPDDLKLVAALAEKFDYSRNATFERAVRELAERRLEEKNDRPDSDESPVDVAETGDKIGPG